MPHRTGLIGPRPQVELRDPTAAMHCLRSIRVRGERPAGGGRQPGGDENQRYSNRDVRKGSYIGQELTIIAWVWARTVSSPDPAAHSAQVPPVRSFVLSA